MKISKYFSEEEVRCKHCGKLPRRVKENLIIVAHKLDPIREIVGVPFVVTSGYRCWEHERAIGGSGHNHPYGFAIDWYPRFEPDNPEEVVKKVEETYGFSWERPIRNYNDFFQFMAHFLDFIWDGGLGIYYNDLFFHTDIREKRRWVR